MNSLCFPSISHGDLVINITIDEVFVRLRTRFELRVYDTAITTIPCAMQCITGYNCTRKQRFPKEQQIILTLLVQINLFFIKELIYTEYRSIVHLSSIFGLTTYKVLRDPPGYIPVRWWAKPALNLFVR